MDVCGGRGVPLLLLPDKNIRFLLSCHGGDITSQLICYPSGSSIRSIKASVFTLKSLLNSTQRQIRKRWNPAPTHTHSVSDCCPLQVNKQHDGNLKTNWIWFWSPAYLHGGRSFMTVTATDETDETFLIPLCCSVLLDKKLSLSHTHTSKYILFLQ